MISTYSSHATALKISRLLLKHIPILPQQSTQNEKRQIEKVKIGINKVDQHTIYLCVVYCKFWTRHIRVTINRLIK